jgi:hypothetical protein
MGFVEAVMSQSLIRIVRELGDSRILYNVGVAMIVRWWLSSKAHQRTRQRRRARNGSITLVDARATPSGSMVVHSGLCVVIALNAIKADGAAWAIFLRQVYIGECTSAKACSRRW